jgi:hypothetical protein
MGARAIMISVRRILIILGLAFTAYLAARGLLWGNATPPQPALLFAGLGIYLATTWTCLFWEPKALPEPGASESDSEDEPSGRAALPVWACTLALAAAVIVPNAVALAVDPEARTATYAAWVIGGIGALMTIVMVRRRPWVAWTGTALMAASCMFWMGPLNALGLGLVGSLVWVIVAHLLLISINRAARDTRRLTMLQRAASAWQASQTVRQRERRVQVQRALAVAGPVLTQTVATGGVLDGDARLEARIAEGRLRDELRGPRLLDEEVRAGIDAARRRGASVTVLDEGGLDGLDDATLTAIRAQLAGALSVARSDRLYIRTSPHERVAVTVVGRSTHEGSDEEVVDLWEEIAHERPSDETA